MGKRSRFERVARDYYRTWDHRALKGLAPLLLPLTEFVEPCAGAGDLIRQLEDAGHLCTAAYDIAPGNPSIVYQNVLSLNQLVGDCFITNPPWSRKLLHQIIAHLSAIGPTWLLFDAGWAYSAQAAPFLPFCRLVVSVGRLKWFENSAFDAMDDCAWYLFDQAAAAADPMIGPFLTARNFLDSPNGAEVVAFARSHLRRDARREAA